MKFSKTSYLHGFTFIVLALGLVRLYNSYSDGNSDRSVMQTDSTTMAEPVVEQISQIPESTETTSSDSIIPADTRTPHRILSVPRFDNTFPDLNDVQMIAAQKHGVKPVANAEEAEMRKSELVYVGSNPWFYVDRLKSSIPYLVPRASILLQDIGRAFYDSLDVKGVPLHKIIASSIQRSKEDVQKLRTRNANATENSCHLYGTTFDVCYNRYKTVEDPDGPKRREVTNDTLKWVLSEVLRDMREAGRCYVKYEVKQGCFHITTR